MTARWIFAHKLPHICVGDFTRGKLRYDGERDETKPYRPVDHGSDDFLEMWQVTDVTRNGWITLERNTRRNGCDMWTETGETRKIRGRKQLVQMIVALHPTDHRWNSDWNPSKKTI